jgi:4-hydroxy-tetrahydrodipicolinate synthase
VPSIHPFTAEGALDEEGLRAHFRRLAAAGVCVWVANEGTGESFTFSSAEMRRVLEIAKEELHGKVPVRGMGRAVRTSAEMIEFCRLVQEVGLDGVNIYPLDMGHGMRPDEREQEAYLTEVLESVRLPTVLTINMFAGWTYPIELIEKMVNRYEHIVGAIAGTMDVRYLAQLIDAVGERIEIHGGSVHALTTLALGGDGFSALEGNLAPRLCVSVIEHYKAGRYAEAEVAFNKMFHLWPITGKYGFGRGTKAALNLLGLPGGYTRKPRLPVPDEALSAIAQLLDKMDISALEGLDPPITR